MPNTRFFSLSLAGRAFYGDVSASGPVIVDDRGAWVALGVSSIVKIQNPSITRVMSEGGGFDDRLTDPEYRWWIVKYASEMRIRIDDLSGSDRTKLAEAFGIPIFENGIGGRDYGKRFVHSKAAEGLRDWAKKHPRLLKNYAGFDDYIAGWSDKITQSSSTDK